MTDTPNNINIEVNPSYIEEQSDPQNNHFVFSYTVTIINIGLIAAKLLTRHWIITDGNGIVQEVKGDGVVGKNPHLKPGEGFEYTSGTFMKTPVGTMQGTYQMISDEGVKFDATIPSFTLSVPNFLH